MTFPYITHILFDYNKLSLPIYLFTLSPFYIPHSSSLLTMFLLPRFPMWLRKQSVYSTCRSFLLLYISVMLRHLTNRKVGLYHVGNWPLYILLRKAY